MITRSGLRSSYFVIRIRLRESGRWNGRSCSVPRNGVGVNYCRYSSEPLDMSQAEKAIIQRCDIDLAVVTWRQQKKTWKLQFL